MKIYQLFPEPVCTCSLERKLTQEELKIINEYKKETHKNEGNITSNNNYVLENKTLKNLKKDLHTKVMEYFAQVIGTDNPITIYITQSWFNYTKSDQFHHQHNHPNSYASGVFYISADKEVDSITFYKPNVEDRIKLHVIKHNPFNSTTLRFPVETGNVFLFPSRLVHGVDKKKGNNIRTSLSFNVFFKGTIGNDKALTELVL